MGGATVDRLHDLERTIQVQYRYMYKDLRRSSSYVSLKLALGNVFLYPKADGGLIVRISKGRKELVKKALKVFPEHTFASGDVGRGQYAYWYLSGDRDSNLRMIWRLSYECY